MGYAVLHIDKARSNDSGNTAHIARTYTPSNVDPSRTRLNRELVQFPANVTNRSEAIEHRIATAGIYRKVAKNQVKALRFILSSSPEDMARIGVCSSFIALHAAVQVSQQCLLNRLSFSHFMFLPPLSKIN